MPGNIDPQIVALAQELADKSGDVLRRYFRQPIIMDQKSDASPVTAADREAEHIMRQLIESRFPDHGIIGEEYGNLRPEAPYQWILDPIDGTRSFIAGFPLFTTLIALAYQGKPILGIINQPITNERWLGIEGQSIAASTRTDGLSNATIATTSTYYFTATQAAAFERLRGQCGNTVLGGDAYAYAMLASGQIDLVVDAGMKPYDFCAPAAVITAVGAIITDWNGNPLTTTSDGNIIAATNKIIHRKAIEILHD